MYIPENAPELIADFIAKAEEALSSRPSDDTDPENKRIFNGFLADAHRFLAAWCKIEPGVFTHNVEEAKLDYSRSTVRPPSHSEIIQVLLIPRMKLLYGRVDEPGRHTRLQIPIELKYVLYNIERVRMYGREAAVAYKRIRDCIASLKELISSVRSKEQVDQHRSEAPKVKEKKEIHAAITPIYSLEPPRSFSDMRLRLIEDDKCIRVYTPGQTEGLNASYTQFGMVDNRTGKPIDLWYLLLYCIESGGKLPQLPEGSDKERNQLKSVKRRIKEKLCAAFGTDEDPFTLLADGTGYQLKCQIEVEQRSNREKLETDLDTDIETIDGKQKLSFWQPERTRHHNNDE